MHQRHNENMIFAILTIFEHLGPHQPLLKARHFGFFKIFLLDLAYGLSCTSHGLEGVDAVRLFFSGLCSSKIDRARACPATSERDTILDAVRWGAWRACLAQAGRGQCCFCVFMFQWVPPWRVLGGMFLYVSALHGR